MITTTKKIGRRILLKINRDIVDMKSGEEFKAALMDLYNQGEKEIVLDFGNTQWINSHGIGKILMFYRRFQEIGGRIYVSPLNDSIREIFDTLMLDNLIPEIEL